MDLEIRIAFQNLTTAAKKNRKEKKNPLFFCQLFARTWGGARKSRDVTTEQEICMLFSMYVHTHVNKQHGRLTRSLTENMHGTENQGYDGDGVFYFSS